MKRLVRILVVLALAGAASFYAWHRAGETTSTDQQPGGGRGGRRGGAGQDGPVAVLTTPAKRADVPVTLEAVGTAQALNNVTVRSQVDGRLLELTFREGQDVRRGDVIARIDPTIYQAQYDQAVAKKAQDEANLANARLDLTRYQNLAQTNYGSKQQADTQRASVAQLEAQVKSDQGAIDNTKAYLDYATILAPIDGRTGIRLVDAGNLVKAADTTGIVTITQLRPITVIFNLPQQNLRAVNTAAGAGRVAVEALEADNQNVVASGTLEVVDNQVDPTTGTVKLKAVFPNETLQLWPGSFVNVRLTLETLHDAIVIPTAAVQRGPTGTFVYGVADDKAVLKPVTISRQTETVSVVTAGIAPPERVVTTGFARLTDGERVRVADAETVAAEPQPTTPAPRRRGGGERRGRDGQARDGQARVPDGQAAGPPRERRRRPDDVGTSATSGAPGPEGAPGTPAAPAGTPAAPAGAAAAPAGAAAAPAGAAPAPAGSAAQNGTTGGGAGASGAGSTVP